MALYIDGPASSMEDLTGQDSQLLEVARTEGIDVTQKLALAHEELGIELGGLLDRVGKGDRIASVVVTSPLKLWHTFRTLELTYEDAYHSQLNDRYAGRRDEFRERARRAYDSLIQAGIGMASQPVPRAATPVVASSPGSLPDGTYYVAMAWVNGSGEEGASSRATNINISGSGLMVIPGPAPSAVSSWNVYLGSSPDGLVRQNASTIPPGQTWLQQGGLVAGAAPPEGQPASYTQPVPRLIQRG